MRRISTALYLFAVCILIFVVCKDSSVSTGGSNSNETLIFSFDSISTLGNHTDTSHLLYNLNIHKLRAEFNVNTFDSGLTVAFYVIDTTEHPIRGIGMASNQNIIDSTFHNTDSINVHCYLTPFNYVAVKNFKLYKIN